MKNNLEPRDEFPLEKGTNNILFSLLVFWSKHKHKVLDFEKGLFLSSLDQWTVAAGSCQALWRHLVLPVGEKPVLKQTSQHAAPELKKFLIAMPFFFAIAFCNCNAVGKPGPRQQPVAVRRRCNAAVATLHLLPSACGSPRFQLCGSVQVVCFALLQGHIRGCFLISHWHVHFIFVLHLAHFQKGSGWMHEKKKKKSAFGIKPDV